MRISDWSSDVCSSDLLDLREASGDALLQWSTLNVRRIALDPMARQLSIGQVELWSPMAQTRRDASQRVNWVHVIDQLKALGSGKPAAVAPASAPSAEAPPAEAKPAEAKTAEAK